MGERYYINITEEVKHNCSECGKLLSDKGTRIIKQYRNLEETVHSRQMVVKNNIRWFSLKWDKEF